MYTFCQRLRNEASLRANIETLFRELDSNLDETKVIAMLLSKWTGAGLWVNFLAWGAGSCANCDTSLSSAVTFVNLQVGIEMIANPTV